MDFEIDFKIGMGGGSCVRLRAIVCDYARLCALVYVYQTTLKKIVYVYQLSIRQARALGF